MTREERLQLVAKLHAEGKNDRQIADEIGANKSTVFDTRKSLGLPAHPWKPPVQRPSATKEQYAAWVEQGLSVKQMADKAGIKPKSVARCLRAMRLRAYREANPAAERMPRGDDAFLAAFRPGSYAPPSHSRMAETSNRDGRIYGLPAAICTASSLYGA